MVFVNALISYSYFNNCPVITIPGRVFDVERFFLEDILEATNYMTSDMKKIRNSFTTRTRNNVPDKTKMSSASKNLHLSSIITGKLYKIITFHIKI